MRNALRRGENRLSIAGLGPHGERAMPADGLMLSEEDAETARDRRFTIGAVFHTTGSDWARQQLAGIVATLGRYSAAVIEVADCAFSVDRQVEALQRLVHAKVDAIISIPVGNAAVAEAHRSVSTSGIKLVLMDNAPTGLLPGTDYACLISADNFGLGELAADLLARHIKLGGSVGVLAHGVDFFVTNEREIAFRKWMGTNRPDIALHREKFVGLDDAAPATERLLQASRDINGLFAVWDEPAMEAIAVLRRHAKEIPVSTIDLGNAAAIELARGDLIKGIGAQRPYDQGVAVATATIMALIGRQPPPWVALPGLAVTRDEVIESYQIVWHSPAPSALVKARRTRPLDKK
jgi:ribose transport system substrate-binding protein